MPSSAFSQQGIIANCRLKNAKKWPASADHFKNIKPAFLLPHHKHGIAKHKLSVFPKIAEHDISCNIIA